MAGRADQELIAKRETQDVKDYPSGAAALGLFLRLADGGLDKQAFAEWSNGSSAGS